MIIPSKFNGFHGGVRRCFGDGGGGDGGGTGTGGGNDGVGSAPGVGGDAGGGNTANTSINTNTGNTGNTGVNTNRGSITGMNFNNTSNTAGTSNIRDNSTFRSMGGLPYNQAGGLYNSLLQQGFTGNDIRGALTTQGRPVSDSDYGFLVQNAAMTSPTGRPMAGSDQFFQPVYQQQYQNYARPATQFDVSAYGTQPSRSPASATMSRSAINSKLNDFYNTNYRDNPNGVGMGDTLDFMREKGINRDDFQTWGGVQNYGPQMSMPSMQTQAQQPYNPFSNTYGYGGLPMTAGYGGFGSLAGGLSPFVTGQMPQMQSQFSYQQPSYQPSYQQPSYQPQQQYNPYQQYEQSLGSYNPYQMQSPFSYQQPTPQRTSSGPSQAIVGRSSQMRGTPNVMRRAEGGIASLMDDVE